MVVDLRSERRIVAWGLALTFLVPVLLWNAPALHRPLSAVSGRVTYSGRPVGNMSICLDSEDGHSATSVLKDDGSFQLMNFKHWEPGAIPGRYHAHLLAGRGNHWVLPDKYKDIRTSGLEIDVASDWSYLNIDLE
jgi:hypothetical protein